MMEKKYVFGIRPAAASSGDSNELPEGWWLHGALGPLSILEASKRGWRIIQPSVPGRIAQGFVGVGVALVVMTTVFYWTALVMLDGQQPTSARALTWGIAAGLLSCGIMVPIALQIRKIGAWRPRGPFVEIEILSANLGLFRQELEIVGEGEVVHVRTTARRSTVASALRLARHR